MIALVVFLSAGALASAFPQMEKPHYDLEVADQHFEEFIQQFDKQYADEEEKQMRFEIFKKSLEHINQLNSRSNLTVFGITKFTDLTEEELKTYRGYRPMAFEDGTSCNELSDADVNTGDAPDAFDWRDHSAVTGVKDQQQCGSCWAFSAIGNVEGQYAIKYGKLQQFSEQQLVDCDKNDQACNGGLMDRAFRYIIETGGVESESDYSYKASQGACQFASTKVVARLSDCNHYKISDESKITEILHTTGPLSIAITAESLSYYHKGIVEHDFCPEGLKLDHGVLLVGYGAENGVPFWIVKNSWGGNWGENGYFRMHRGVNMCSLMNDGLFTSVIA